MSTTVGGRKGCSSVPVVHQKFERSRPSMVHQVKTWTINSFFDLSQAFMKQCSIFIPRGESSVNLYNMNQKQGESLRDYIERFKAGILCESGWCRICRSIAEVIMVQMPFSRHVKLKQDIKQDIYIGKWPSSRNDLHKHRRRPWDSAKKKNTFLLENRVLLNKNQKNLTRNFGNIMIAAEMTDVERRRLRTMLAMHNLHMYPKINISDLKVISDLIRTEGYARSEGYVRGEASTSYCDYLQEKPEHSTSECWYL